MHDDTAQQIQDIYNTLPQDIKDVLSSEDAGKKLAAISKNHNLHIDQADELSQLTSLVMLGIISPDDFVNEIESDVHVSSTEAVAIADEINEQILRDIKASLMKVYKDNNLDEADADTDETPEDFSALRAKDILHDIENPVKTESSGSVSVPVPVSKPTPITVATPTPAAIPTKPQPIKPLVEGIGENLIPPPPTPNLIEQKLTQTVRVPEAQKIEITPAPAPKPVSKLPPLTPKPVSNSSGSDAYREPIE